MTRCIWCNRLPPTRPQVGTQTPRPSVGLESALSKEEIVCRNCTNGIANKTCVRCGLTYFSKIKFNTRRGNVCCTCSNLQKQNIY